MNVKQNLIRIGTTNPELRQHIRPILREISSRDHVTVELTEPSGNLDKAVGNADLVTYRGIDVNNVERKAVNAVKNDIDREVDLKRFGHILTVYVPSEDTFTIGTSTNFIQDHDGRVRESYELYEYNAKSGKVRNITTDWQHEISYSAFVHKASTWYGDGVVITVE